MDLKDIEQLALTLLETLTTERKAKVAAVSAVACAERVKVLVLDNAHAGGAIDGKNADTRKRQIVAALAASEAYATELDNVAAMEQAAAMAEISRKSTEAIISLTKAWLYSQSGRISIGLG